MKELKTAESKKQIANKDKAMNDRIKNALQTQIQRDTTLINNIEGKVGQVKSEADKSKKELTILTAKVDNANQQL